ncbi:MAG: hypothetical protein WCZ28_06185 [Burkholderiaceae bacterium]
MTKLLAFFFDGVLGRVVAVGIAFAALLGWWQLDRYGQRQAGAAAERQRTERAAHAQVEQAQSVRADAERSARGERVRAVRRDPYHAAGR